MHITEHTAQDVTLAMQNIHHISIEALQAVASEDVVARAIRLQAIMNLNHDLGRFNGSMRLHPEEFEAAISSVHSTSL